MPSPYSFILLSSPVLLKMGSERAACWAPGSKPRSPHYGVLVFGERHTFLPQQLRLWSLCFEVEVPICSRSAVIGIYCIAQWRITALSLLQPCLGRLYSGDSLCLPCKDAQWLWLHRPGDISALFLFVHHLRGIQNLLFKHYQVKMTR